MMRPVIVLLFSACAAIAQPFSFGIKAGVPFTDAFDTIANQSISFNTTTERYIIGPTAELHLPFGIGFEVDALYRRFHYAGASSILSGVSLTTATSTSVNTGDWEFPVLVKYRLPGKILRPYVDGGVAWNKLQGLTQSISQTASSGGLTVVHKDSTSGIVLGVGADFHFIVHVLPEIRYTHWGSAQLIDPTGFLKSNQNQAEFLVGITF